MPIVDIGAPGYVKAAPKFDLVSKPRTTPLTARDRLLTGEPYLLTDSSTVKDEDESQLDQFACMLLTKDDLVHFCGPEIIETWDRAARLVDVAPAQLPGVNIDHLFVKHLGIILQPGDDELGSEDPCIAIEEEHNTPDRVALQQSILNAFGELMSALVLGIARKLFLTPGYEDLATQIDYMAHILKRRNFPCFGTEANAWYNNLTLHTSTEMMDITRDRANFNGAVPLPILFMKGSGRVYLSRFAQVFEAEPYSLVLVGGAEQVVISAAAPATPGGDEDEDEDDGKQRGTTRSTDGRTIAFGRCEENVFKHYAQYDPMNQLRDRLAKEMSPE